MLRIRSRSSNSGVLPTPPHLLFVCYWSPPGSTPADPCCWLLRQCRRASAILGCREFYYDFHIPGQANSAFPDSKKAPAGRGRGPYGNPDLFRRAGIGRAVAHIARALLTFLVLGGLFFLGLGGGGGAGICRSGSGSTRGSRAARCASLISLGEGRQRERQRDCK